MACRWNATYHWKDFDKGYNFALDLRGLYKEVMGFQSDESPGKNDIWVQPLWAIIEDTVRGKVVIPPSLGLGESCESVYAHGLSVHQKCFKYTLTNLLFSLCRSI